MLLPHPRGPLSAALITALRDDDLAALPVVPDTVDDPTGDDDVQLTLWIAFELGYRGFDGVAGTWEWEPELIRLRTALGDLMLAQVRREAAVPVSAAPVSRRLQQLIADDQGRSTAEYLQRTATRRHVAEYAMQRSVYHLKEADPHSWVIPRLAGRAKAALIEIQSDEYGNGRLDRMHSELFRQTLRGLELDDTYGAYVDRVPGVTFAITNLISVLAFRRELRGALVGHLAAFEMTSSRPSRRVGLGLRRLGYDTATREFYDEHVTADALHEQLAAHDLCDGLAADEPELCDDIVFGAAACLYVDARFADHVLDRWNSGRSSLADPVEALQVAAS